MIQGAPDGRLFFGLFFVATARARRPRYSRRGAGATLQRWRYWTLS
jgi:hypothetical protein